MPQSVNIYLLRHGEITHPDSLAGQTDFSVTEFGYQQMQESTKQLKFDFCISSPLSRCSIFAQDLMQERKKDLLVEPKIKEMNFGDWDGELYETLWQLPKPNIGDFWQSPFRYSPVNGESFNEFVTRVREWWQMLINNRELKDTLVVTHAGVIKCVLAELLSVTGEQEQYEKIATQISIGYGQLVKLSVYQTEGFPAHVQIKL